MSDRRKPRALLALAALLSLTTLAWASTARGDRSPSKSSRNARSQYHQSIVLQQEVLSRTQVLLDKKLALRNGERKLRLRALYKLSRANWPRLWFESRARRERSTWLAAARRMALRDSREVEMLHHEIEMAKQAGLRLARAASLDPSRGPAAHSLAWPVRGSHVVQRYGVYKGPSHRVSLRNRGIRVSTNPGQVVYPVAAGRVRYIGVIRGLGTSLIIDHGGFTSILGGIRAGKLAVGEEVTLETALGAARGKSLYLEIRFDVGSIGQDVNPLPLLSNASIEAAVTATK